MIPLSGETLIQLSQAHKHFPVPVSQRTIYHLADDHPSRPTLETLRVGTKRFTSKEAIERFLVANNHTQKVSPSC